MKKLVFGILFLIVLVGSVSALPVIDSIEGNLSDGKNVTIQGETFGQTGPTIYKWDDFEGDTHVVGENVGAGPGSVAWTLLWSLYNPMKISGNGRTAIDDQYARGLYGWGTATSNSGIAYTHGGSKNAAIMSQAYVTWYQSWSGVIVGSNIKIAHPFANWCDSSWHYAGSVVQMAWSKQTIDEILYFTPYAIVAVGWPDGTCSDGAPAGGYTTYGGGFTGDWTQASPANFTWGRYEVWGVESSVNQFDGTVLMNAQVAEGSPFIKIFNNNSDIRTRTLDQWHWYGSMFGYYVSGTIDAGFDDIYIASSRARIELGNNQNFSLCTHREIQIPQQWSDGSITFTVNQGSFSDGETAYVFVVDENGNVSSGKQITFSGESNGTQPPVVYATPHIQDYITLQEMLGSIEDYKRGLTPIEQVVANIKKFIWG